MDFPTFMPPVLPEETLLGYLMRLSIASGWGMRPLVRHVVGRTALQPPWLIPSNVTRLCARLAPVLPDPGIAILEHTVLPAVLPFLEAPARQAIEAHAREEREVRGVFALAGFANRSVSGQAQLKLCLDCVDESLHTFGTGYWSRLHQWPGISTCPRHLRPLHVGCGRCRQSQRNTREARWPEPRCWCGARHRQERTWSSLTSARADSRIAQIACGLLRAGSAGIDRDLVRVTYRRRLVELGYAKGRYMATPRLEESFCKAFPSELLRAFGADIKTDGRSWLAEAATGHVPKSPLRNFLLIDFLFDGLEGFLERVRTARPEPNETPARRRVSTPTVSPAVEQTDVPAGVHPVPVEGGELECRRATARNALESLLTRAPDTSRTEALRALGRTFVWLRVNDGAWLDALLPARRNRVGELAQASSRAYWTQLDVSASAFVVQRHAVLSDQARRPQRISPASLLAGFPRANELYRHLRDLPCTRKALDSLTESSFEYRVRLAVWLVLHPKAIPGGENPLDYAYRATHLSKRVIARAIERFIASGEYRRR